MKALSLRQPWAWACVFGGKDVENRQWNTSHRGRFLIHAAKGCTLAEYTHAVEWMVSRGLALPPDGMLLPHPTVVCVPDHTVMPVVPAFDKITVGGIIGVAELVDVMPPASDGVPRAAWHMPEQHGFVLRNVKSLPFTPLRGMLNFFDVPEAVLEKLRPALEVA